MAKKLSFFFILIAVFICTGIVAFGQSNVTSFRYIYDGTEKIYIIRTEDGEYPLIKTEENASKVDYPVEEENTSGKVDYPIEEENASKVDYPIEEENTSGKVDYSAEEKYTPGKVDYPAYPVKEDVNLREEENSVKEELEEKKEEEPQQNIVDDILLNEEINMQLEETTQFEEEIIEKETNKQEQSVPIIEPEVEEVYETEEIEQETETQLEENEPIIVAEEINEEETVSENTLEILAKDKNTKNTAQFLVTITNPVESELTFSSSYVLSGVANEGIENITVLAYILDEETNTFIPYKNTDGEYSWDIGKSGIFIKEVILPKEGINEIRIVVFNKSEAEKIELNVNLQVNDFSINLLDDSIKDIFNQEI